jgi:hypothetical protein
MSRRVSLDHGSGTRRYDGAQNLAKSQLAAARRPSDVGISDVERVTRIELALLAMGSLCHNLRATWRFADVP